MILVSSVQPADPASEATDSQDYYDLWVFSISQ